MALFSPFPKIALGGGKCSRCASWRPTRENCPELKEFCPIAISISSML